MCIGVPCRVGESREPGAKKKKVVLHALALACLDGRIPRGGAKSGFWFIVLVCGVCVCIFLVEHKTAGTQSRASFAPDQVQQYLYEFGQFFENVP